MYDNSIRLDLLLDHMFTVVNTVRETQWLTKCTHGSSKRGNYSSAALLQASPTESLVRVDSPRLCAKVTVSPHQPYDLEASDRGRRFECIPDRNSIQRPNREKQILGRYWRTSGGGKEHEEGFIWGERNDFDISARSKGRRRTEVILCASLFPVGPCLPSQLER